MTVISITLPGELVKKVDELVKERGYYSRSEAFRDAIRSLIAEAELGRSETGTMAAVILIASDIRRRDVDVKLVELRNEFEDVIVENLHRHIENEYCIDVFLAQGEQKRISTFVGRVRGMRGVREVKSIFLPLKHQPKV
jgi:CopG family nickel-responsive transcriptional regulator